MRPQCGVRIQVPVEEHQDLAEYWVLRQGAFIYMRRRRFFPYVSITIWFRCSTALGFFVGFIHAIIWWIRLPHSGEWEDLWLKPVKVIEFSYCILPTTLVCILHFSILQAYLFSYWFIFSFAVCTHILTLEYTKEILYWIGK